MMGQFGMDKVSAFAPPPPQMEQPKEEGGKGGMGILNGVLGLASLIPGPQQPFVAGAAAAGKMAQGAINRNPQEMLSGATGLVGLAPFQQLMGNAPGGPASQPGAAPGAMMQQATQGLQGGVPGAMQQPSFGGYNFEFNPYQTSQYPFFR